ncbi:MAG TPA: tetratricopeptide repeat protein [Vicinamibacterales bacterium]|jgi:Flp pilus assembly protein TadD/mono/diheme cytochrome c family protein
MIAWLLAAAAAAAPTYTTDVAPLLNDRCAVCHHDNGSAPFSLLTYEDAKRHARQIADVTRRRVMPPWKMEPGYGPFVGQHPLSGDEIDLLGRWADAGAPRGEGPAPTAKMRWTDTWQLGKPDLVVTLPEPFVLPPEGTDVFRIFVVPIPVATERFVRGIEFRPGNARVVHHANIRVDPTPASKALDDKDPGPGYSGLILRSATYPDGNFLGWTPGQVAPLAPPDLAWRLEPHTDLVIETHMQPSGKPEKVQPSVAFYFGDTPPTRTPAMLRLGRQSIDIPAGDKSYTITDSYVLPVDVDVLALQPHAHYRLREARGDATLPDGTVKPLLLIKDWDFRWQHVYRYVTPLALPKGTTLSMRYVYDNSTDNPRNPERPPKRARWGQRSADEMGDLWIQALTHSEADLVTLDASFRRKVVAEDVNGYEMEIERHPDDVGLLDTAALLYLELGRPDRAVDHFQRSLSLKPTSAPAHYNLGTALTLAHRLDDAATEYREAIRIDPGYANAHNNLGNVLLAQGKVDDAIREFREVVRLQPDSPTAKANLAAALQRKAPKP